jgi:hypothetical protein
VKRPILGFLAAATLSFGFVGTAPALAHDDDGHSRKHERRYHTPSHGDHDGDHDRDHGRDHDRDRRGRHRKQCEGLIAICLL